MGLWSMVNGSMCLWVYGLWSMVYESMGRVYRSIGLWSRVGSRDLGSRVYGLWVYGSMVYGSMGLWVLWVLWVYGSMGLGSSVYGLRSTVYGSMGV